MMDKADLERLEELAKKVSQSAYCPYSKFSVGAVVVTETGEEFAGCNVENASYGLTICAERNAVFQMVARDKLKIAMIIIYTPTPQPSAPCGACRQVINEFGPSARVIAICDGDARIDTTLAQLLPQAFGPNIPSDPYSGHQVFRQMKADDRPPAAAWPSEP